MKSNSFVLYDSDYAMIRRMTDEQRGQWISAIFENVINGCEAEIKDQAVAIAYDTTMDHIEKDRKKYVETCKKRSEAGKLGNEKRWRAKEVSQKSQMRQKRSKPSQTSLCEFEFVSSNDDDNARARVASPSSSPLPDYVTMYASVTTLAEKAKHDDVLIEHIMRTQAISRMQAIDAIDSFTSYLAAIKETTHDVRDFSKHLLCWIRKNKPTTNNQQPPSCGLTIPTPTTR